MAWWEGFEETRILIAPSVSRFTTATENKGHFLSLRHPKQGNSSCYFLINGSLQELHWLKQSYGSWFVGDYVCEDGRLYTATPVDPVFILLPIFEEARMKKDGDQGKFRQLDEIMFIDGYPGYQHLLSIAEESMQVVCEMKEIGSLKFFRLDDSKMLAWLCRKVEQLKPTLLALDKNYAAQDEQAILADAVSLVGEYLKEPLLKCLCNHLQLDFQELTRKASVQLQETVSGNPEEGTPGSSTPSQANGSSQSKKSGKGKQVKKMKTETNSHNIRDMFSRASRRS
ncbi:hypothetical protein Syun_011524 [Stephania yunnanensis]|uniref:Ribonuclease H2 subunit B n=1 Tax=Stephania yunnanensis TaxID=152371 RepID=A0AAP0JYE8_9MAGN